MSRSLVYGCHVVSTSIINGNRERFFRAAFQEEPTFIGASAVNGEIFIHFYSDAVNWHKRMEESPALMNVKVITIDFQLLRPGEYMDNLEVIDPLVLHGKPFLLAYYKKPPAPALVAVSKTISIHAGMMVPRFWEQGEEGEKKSGTTGRRPV